MVVPRRIGEWTLVTHTTFAPGHELARPGLEPDSAPSIVVSEGRSHEGLDQWPSYDGPRLARRRAVIQDDGVWVVLEDVGLATSFVEFPRVLPIRMAWTLGRAIARALEDLHDAGFVIGGLMPSIVFVDPEGDVSFAPRVLAFRPASLRTTTREANVAVLALERTNAAKFEEACKTTLLDRLLGVPKAAPDEPYRCPSCGSPKVAYEYFGEFTKLKCTRCGHDDTVDLVQLAEWR